MNTIKLVILYFVIIPIMVISLFYGMGLMIKGGVEAEHQVWCEQQRINTQNTFQEWTPALKNSCGEF